MKNEPRTCLNHVMSRAQFLRTLAISAVGLASGITSFEIKQARAQLAVGEVAVYPTGQFPFDVHEVSAAVNGGVGPSGTNYPGGGIVRLKATGTNGTPMFFNFGGAYTGFPGPSNLGRGSVQVTRDVTILGEPMSPTSMSFPFDAAPEPGYTPDRTVIYGGKRAFVCPSNAPTPPKLTVRSLFFAYPSLAAVQAVKTVGLDISDCVIYDVKPDDTGLVLAGIPFWIGSGIEATGLVTSADQVSGDYRVANNRIRRVSPIAIPVPPFALGTGIILNIASMNGQIIGNEAERFPFQGVAIGQNDGTVTVARNGIVNCGYGGQPLAAGIAARATTSPMLIEHNRVTGGYAAPLSLLSKHGIGLASSNAVVRANIIDGTFALQGIFLTSYSNTANTWFATDNRFENNDLSDSTTVIAQVLLEPGCDRNRFANNDYGSVDPGAEAGMIVESSSNAFVNEDFWGTYAGIPSQPCVLLAATSHKNTISAFKYQGAPQGFDVCNQVLDQGSNSIEGSEKCK